MNWINCHIIDWNLGDRVSAPSRYFDGLGEEISISNNKCLGQNLIIGGGGLLHDGGFEKRVDELIRSSNKCIIWGVGTNFHHQLHAKYLDSFEKCDLVGIRDFGCGYEWVPCSSCMAEEFDVKYEIKHKIVAYLHYAVPVELPDNIPSLKNNCKELSEVVKFLSSGEYVLTNTYHGMYWSFLLGKNVMVYKPFSNRFLYFKYKPIFLNSLKNLEKLVSSVSNNISCLDECRKANIDFYNRVLSII